MFSNKSWCRERRKGMRGCLPMRLMLGERLSTSLLVGGDK